MTQGSQAHSAAGAITLDDKYTQVGGRTASSPPTRGAGPSQHDTARPQFPDLSVSNSNITQY
jgi:hypothetical protein